MRKSDRSQINEINVVPYVDVMLVLLVVFMVTAPLLVQGIKIDLPETTSSVLEESELEELTLTIDKKGQFFIEFESYKNKSFSIDTLKPVLEDIFKINNNLNVYIRGDKDVEYDNVLKLLAVIQNLDPISINLISDPINNDYLNSRIFLLFLFACIFIQLLFQH